MEQKRQRAVIIVTGIMASGKSTVAELLAKKCERGVHLRGDVFRRMIVSGREEMLPDAGEEALRQLRLRYQIAAQTADTYAEADFDVVLQDVILGPMLAEMIQWILHRPLYVVVLAPNPDTVAAREAARPKSGYGPWTVEQLDKQLREDTPRIGLWIDSSSMSAEQTADLIWEKLWTEAQIQ